MTEYETCLFIGGKCDGQRLQLREKLKCVSFPVFDPLPGLPIWQDDIREEVYRREILAAENERFAVYVLSDMTLGAAMRKLIGDYRPASLTQPAPVG